ncbi:MAG: pilus assembly protein TadG-related protein [Rhodobacteraceae bacterium]|nr:pilus assembly protein TadG-related protein [Paracoccaceae bacterium]
MRFFKTKRYLDDEGGAISAFVLVMFLTMIVGGGMGIDFMYHESERAELQDALDRGVLASASFDISNYEGNTEAERTAFIQARVESYLRTNSLMALRNPTINVVPDVSGLSRRISVTGTYEIDTFFLKLVGIDSLTVSGTSTAAAEIRNVEISLILDNSGSMWDRKIKNLISSSSNFVDLILTPEAIDYTTISLVPFTSSVNLGADFASYYNVNIWHDYSYCIQFAQDSEFNVTSISPTDLYQQEQNYQRDGGPHTSCPSATILPLSNDPVELKDALSSMVAGGYTASWAGMKWGVALLDPGTQSVVTELIADNEVDSVFAGRPQAWGSSNSTKIIILMTDGRNTTHLVMRPDRYNRMNTTPWRSQANADFWEGRNTRKQALDQNLTITSEEGDSRLIDICNAAKADIPGIEGRPRTIIYTIGFEVAEGSNPYTQMRNCASSPSKFYHVGNAELNSAFTQIANSINRLRLVD